MPLKTGEGRGPFTLRMCLFGDEIGWMENFGEKNEKGNFFRGCLAERERGGNDGRARQKVLSKMERKLGEGNLIGEDENAHVQVVHGLLQYIFVFVFLIFNSNFNKLLSVSFVWCLIPAFFFLFFFLFRCDFFS